MSDTADVSGQSEVEEYLRSALGPGPKSPSEAARAAEAAPEVSEDTTGEDRPIVVSDEPPARQPEPEPEVTDEQPPEEPEEQPEEEEGDPHVAWAERKYGDDTSKWARAAYEMEQHIGRLANEKREAEEFATQAYEALQEQQAQAQMQPTGMPLSAAEEEWIERSSLNPLEAARQAAFAGNVSLFNGVLARVAEENPMMAGQISAQVTAEVQQALQEQQTQQVQAATPVPLEQTLAGSFQRLGINMQTFGPRMSEVLGDLGEYHPYVQAILNGDQAQADLAVQAVYDLARTRPAARNPRQADREEALSREAELRRSAAVVQTGGSLHPQQPPAGSSYVEQMQEEWRRAGQWQEDEQ